MGKRYGTAIVAAAAALAVAGQATAKGGFEQGESAESKPGITLRGAGLASVNAPARPTEQSVERAVETAQRLAASRALNSARRRARLVAKAAGVSLGQIQAIADEQAGYYAPSSAAEGPFCRTTHNTQAAKRTRPRCRVPKTVAAASSVTFAIAGAAESPGSREATGLGARSIDVVPRDRNDNAAIREAVERARSMAIPQALAAARTSAELQARLAQMTLGPVVSISENSLAPYASDFAPFGPGRYCGVTRRPIFESVPGSRRRKIVGFERARRCFVPRRVSASFYVTYASS